MVTVGESNVKSNFASRLAMFEKNTPQSQVRTAKPSVINRVMPVNQPEKKKEPIASVSTEEAKDEVKLIPLGKVDQLKNKMESIAPKEPVKPQTASDANLPIARIAPIIQPPTKPIIPANQPISTPVAQPFVSGPSPNPTIASSVNTPVSTSKQPQPSLSQKEQEKQFLPSTPPKPISVEVPQPKNNSSATINQPNPPEKDSSPQKPLQTTSKFSNLMNIFNKQPEEPTTKPRSRTLYPNAVKRENASAQSKLENMEMKEDNTKEKAQVIQSSPTPTISTSSKPISPPEQSVAKSEPETIQPVQALPAKECSNEQPKQAQPLIEPSMKEKIVNEGKPDLPSQNTAPIKEDIKTIPLPKPIQSLNPKPLEVKPTSMNSPGPINPPQEKSKVEPVTNPITKPVEPPAPNKIGSMLSMFEKGAQKPTAPVKSPIKIPAAVKPTQSAKEVEVALPIEPELEEKPKPILKPTTSTFESKEVKSFLENQMRFGSLSRPNQMRQAQKVESPKEEEEGDMLHEMDLRNEKPVLNKRKSEYRKHKPFLGA